MSLYKDDQLALGGSLHLLAHAIDDPQETKSVLEAELEFEQRAIKLFGKQMVQPRLIAWAGELPYSYSGDTLAPRPFPRQLGKMLELVNRIVQKGFPEAPRFNHVLCNLYRDGNDSMGLHADDEPELGIAPYVASVSLGAQRCFQIAPKRKYRNKSNPTEKKTLLLPSGSLLVMAPPMQRYYLHGIQKTRRDVGPRLNLTFRAIVA